MSPLPFFRRAPQMDSSARSGAALIIVLCYLVLICAMLIGFLARVQIQGQISYNSVNQANAGLLALSAADTVVGELRSEIAATNCSQIFNKDGTVAVSLAAAVPPLVFEPLVATNVLPQRRGETIDPSWLNVVKLSTLTRSDAATPAALYAGGRSLISTNAIGNTNAGAATPSLNGRSIDDTVWRAPYLVPNTGTLAPNWCIVTRQGVQSCADGDVPQLSNFHGNQFAIGRFAFVVYDEGGLLDINAAGNALLAATNATRAFLNQADLTQIPGIGNPVSFVAWRSAATKANQAYLLAGTNSYLRVQVGDQAFVSRQDLINYALTNASILSTNALPYLTTFSREMNAPSWWPEKDASSQGGAAGSAYAYSSNQNSSTATNRFLPNVRVSQTVTLPFYKIDGTTNAYTLYAGQPLLQRRFPLQRLNWLGTSGPNSGAFSGSVGSSAQTAAIQACFGLVWDATNKRWTYAGPTGSAAQTSIATLATVATQNRNPNFFELLQAGILSGSLGLNTDAQSDAQSILDPTANAAYYGGASAAANQVLQIGANIIDQWSADALPNRFYFNGEEFYGSKSLPIINTLLFSAYRPVVVDPTQHTIRSWLEFQMWNPYGTNSVAVPTNGTSAAAFQIVQSSTGIGAVRMEVDPYTPSSTTFQFATPGTTSDTLTASASSSLINFSQTAADPQLISSLWQNAGFSVTGSSANDLCNDTGSSPKASYAGIWLGDLNSQNAFWPGAPTIPGVTSPSGTIPWWNTTALLPAGIGNNFTIHNINAQFLQVAVYKLQYKYPDGSYRTVQQFSVADGNNNTQVAINPNTAYPSPVTINGTDQLNVPNQRYIAFATLDPRTMRFGAMMTSGRQMVSGAPYVTFPAAFYTNTIAANPADKTTQYNTQYNPYGPTFVPNNPPTGGSGAMFSPRFADNQGSGTTADPYYTDPDGVQRPGDAVWSTGGNGSWPMASYTTHSQDRPIMLNRPFQSTAELGYAFRDLPFKSLDFSSTKSADSGLLDLFCLDTGDATNGIAAGRVDLNTRHPEVLEALLSGATRTAQNPSSTANQISAANAATIANAIVAMTTNAATGGPLENKADLATRFTDSTYSGFVKSQREAAIRALSDAGQTRTWNLMIDMIAQVGRYPSTAKTLRDFSIEGERRYWIHVAIDRYTGQILSLQPEAVEN